MLCSATEAVCSQSWCTWKAHNEIFMSNLNREPPSKVKKASKMRQIHLRNAAKPLQQCRLCLTDFKVSSLHFYILNSNKQKQSGFLQSMNIAVLKQVSLNSSL